MTVQTNLDYADFAKKHSSCSQNKVARFLTGAVCYFSVAILQLNI